MEGRVYLMNIYDKSDFSSVDLSVLQELVRNLVRTSLQIMFAQFEKFS